MLHHQMNNTGHHVVVVEEEQQNQRGRHPTTRGYGDAIELEHLLLETQEEGDDT